MRLTVVASNAESELAITERRIRDCERRIRKLETLLEGVRADSRQRFIGAGLLTEFKIALREYRRRHELLRR